MAEACLDQVDVDFLEFDSIDYDELFVDGEVLSYLETESELVGGVSSDSCYQAVPSWYSGEICALGATKEGEIGSKKSKLPTEGDKSTTTQAKINNDGRKRKTKVDWTPELHRRFVKAVEQLGLDKAMPSRVLELMGVHHLTRHNVANHLQKYRSYRKHLAARVAEAMTWTHKRQSYDAAVAPPNHPLFVPTVGFPPPTSPPIHHHPFQPVHVWGHSTHQRHATAPTLVIPAVYKLHWDDSGPSCDPLDLHPSKESIDATIEDALSKPRQPLPIGLKPPSIDGVIGELQR